MKHLELHILQSVPVSCLNRDDLNSPKTAIFGGVQRARVSSQCWKRAIREMAKEESKLFQGNRTKLFVQELMDSLGAVKGKLSSDDAYAISFCAGHYLARIDSKDPKKVKTLIFLSKQEYSKIAKKITELDEEQRNILIQAYNQLDSSKLSSDDDSVDEENEEDEIDKKSKKELKGKLSPKQFLKIITKPLKIVFKDFNKTSLQSDAADIAIFGRMVANEPNINLEGATMFSHPISTHKADNEIDFFTAIDDLQSGEESGAGMMGTIEYNSATYYRFAALNLGMLYDESHLKELSQDERIEVVRTFVKSTLMAIPSAKMNSMNGNTLPGYVLCVVRDKGHPIQLVNAFEKPIQEKNGVFDKSVDRLKEEYKKIKETWDLDEKAVIAMPEKSLKELLDEVSKYVE